MEYRLVFLTSGQQAPTGSTGIVVNNGIVWTGDEGTFPPITALGVILSTDPPPITTYNNRIMTEEELSLYNEILNKPE